MKKKDAKQYAAALQAACQGKKKNEIDDIVRTFVLQWGARGHLTFLTAVLSELTAIQEREKGIERVECRLAHYSEKEAKTLTAVLSKQLKKDVDMSVVEDSSLIAGAVLTVGDTRIDGSLKARIRQLQRSLQ